MTTPAGPMTVAEARINGYRRLLGRSIYPANAEIVSDFEALIRADERANMQAEAEGNMRRHDHD